MIHRQEMSFQGMAPFSLDIRYVETTARSKENVFDHHVHDACEIYINLSGDVSFMVEKHIYPISPGSVILTRPDEFHHCIYNSDQGVHKHFWILFTCEGNEKIFPRFFQREAGCENLSLLTPDALSRARDICMGLIAEKKILARYAFFFQLLQLLEQGAFPREQPGENMLPNDVRIALDYIYENLSYPIAMADVAAAAHVSLNTLERHFLSVIQVSPSEFIRQRRLSKAQELLRSGAAVNEACQACGFSDCSHFIVLFKKQFGMTPLQYKKIL